MLEISSIWSQELLFDIPYAKWLASMLSRMKIKQGINTALQPNCGTVTGNYLKFLNYSIVS